MITYEAAEEWCQNHQAKVSFWNEGLDEFGNYHERGCAIKFQHGVMNTQIGGCKSLIDAVSKAIEMMDRFK